MCLVLLFLLAWHILLTSGSNLTEIRGTVHTMCPVNVHFYDKAVQPNDAGFLCPSCSQGFEPSQQCRRFPVALGPLASCFSFGKRTIYDPEASHPGRPLLSQFRLFSPRKELSFTPIPQQSCLFLPDQRFICSCEFPSVLFTVPSLSFTWPSHIHVILSWIALSWKLVIQIQGWLIGISFVLLCVVADFWMCFQLGLPLIREMHWREKSCLTEL